MLSSLIFGALSVINGTIHLADTVLHLLPWPVAVVLIAVVLLAAAPTAARLTNLAGDAAHNVFPPRSVTARRVAKAAYLLISVAHTYATVLALTVVIRLAGFLHQPGDGVNTLTIAALTALAWMVYALAAGIVEVWQIARRRASWLPNESDMAEAAECRAASEALGQRMRARGEQVNDQPDETAGADTVDAHSVPTARNPKD